MNFNPVRGRKGTCPNGTEPDSDGKCTSVVARADLICNCLASDLIPLFLSAANRNEDGSLDGWYSLVTELAPNGLDTPSLTGIIATSAALAMASTDSQENEVMVFLKQKDSLPVF